MYKTIVGLFDVPSYFMYSQYSQIKSELRGSAFEYKGVKLVVGKGNIAYKQTDVIVNSTSDEFTMNGQISQAIGIEQAKNGLQAAKASEN